MKQTDFIDERPDIQLVLSKLNASRKPISFLADGLSNIVNLGMIFRIADAIPIRELLILEYDKSLKISKISKFSRSAEKYVPYRKIEIDEISSLKSEYQLVTLEKTSHSIDYHNYKPGNKPVLLIFGSEKNGVSKELILNSDVSIHLKMNGVNTSINVATAVSVAAFYIASFFE